MAGRSATYEGGRGTVQGIVALGTGAVATQTKIVGVAPKKMEVTDITFFVQAAATATALTAQVYARTTAGATGNDLCAALSIKVAAAATGKAGLSATLESTNPEHLWLEEGQLFEVVVTADTCSAGPGDLVTVIGFNPRA